MQRMIHLRDSGNDKPCSVSDLPDSFSGTQIMPNKKATKRVPPDGLPAYRLLTGPDDAAFCRRVSEALALGYKLYGSPSATFNGKDVIVAQAVIWPSVDTK